MRSNMRNLHDPKFLKMVAEGFDARNRKLTINDTRVGENESPFAAYLQAFWKQNEEGFNLAAYRKLSHYRPEDSDIALRTYKRFFLEEPKRVEKQKRAGKAKKKQKQKSKARRTGRRR